MHGPREVVGAEDRLVELLVGEVSHWDIECAEVAARVGAHEHHAHGGDVDDALCGTVVLVTHAGHGRTA